MTDYELHRQTEARLEKVEAELSEANAKLDRLLAYAEQADTAVKGFLGGKNAKYLMLLAKAKGMV